MGYKIEFMEGSKASGFNIGNNNVVNNNIFDDFDKELRTFSKVSNTVLEQLDSSSQEYEIFEPIVTSANEGRGNDVINQLRTYSLDFWKKLFIGATSTGVIELIKRWLS